MISRTDINAENKKILFYIVGYFPDWKAVGSLRNTKIVANFEESSSPVETLFDVLVLNGKVRTYPRNAVGFELI